MENDTNKKFNNPTSLKNTIKKILSQTAIFISLLSLFAVIYQSYLGREENKLIRIQQSATVLPYLGFWPSQTNNQIELIISNQGVGPAFIKEVNFKTLDNKGKDTLTFENTDDFFAFIRTKQPFLDSLEVTTSTFEANTLLPSGVNKKIINIKYSIYDQGNKIREVFDKSLINYKIIYEDIYGTRWYIGRDTQSPIKIEK